MGEARAVFDRLTDAINNHDADAIGACFSPDAEAVDPLETVRGRAEIVKTWRRLFEAFPDMNGRVIAKYEVGDTAIDEWTFTGTHTGRLRTPDGEAIPPTGKRVTMRGADFGTVENGLITSHRAYFDQMEMLSQLGLIPEEAQATA